MKFLEPTRKPKVIHPDNSWNLASLARNHHGIIVRQHHTDRKQMRLLREQHAEWKKEHLQCCCSQVWATNGRRIPWNATAFCETFKILYLMGNHHMKGGSECPLTDKRYRLELWSNITLSLRKTHRDCSSLEQTSCQVRFSVMHYTRANLERRHYGCIHWRIGGDGRRLNAEEVLTPHRSGNFIFPVADWTVKVSTRDQRLRTSTLIKDRPERG